MRPIFNSNFTTNDRNLQIGQPRNTNFYHGANVGASSPKAQYR
jgi:hypothetical protein